MRRRLRRRPAPRKALTPKTTCGKPPGLMTRGLYCSSASAWDARFRLERRLSSSFLQGLGGWDAIPFLRSCRGTRRTRTLRFSLLRCGERPGRHPDVASGGYSYPGCPRYATWCERRGGVVRSDIRVPEAKRGRVPCRNEDEHCLLALPQRPISNGIRGRVSPRARPSRSRR